MVDFFLETSQAYIISASGYGQSRFQLMILTQYVHNLITIPLKCPLNFWQSILSSIFGVTMFIRGLIERCAIKIPSLIEALRVSGWSSNSMS